MEELKETETPFDGVPIYVCAEDYAELLAGLRDIYERSFVTEDENILEVRRVASSLLAKHDGAA
ncbi:hypothetical protein GOB40_13645 [Sinorhizobium meliloti]|nr:hypothetical protein [Sinorhizobium meliloti]